VRAELAGQAKVTARYPAAASGAELAVPGSRTACRYVVRNLLTGRRKISGQRDASAVNARLCAKSGHDQGRNNPTRQNSTPARDPGLVRRSAYGKIGTRRSARQPSREPAKLSQVRFNRDGEIIEIDGYSADEIKELLIASHGDEIARAKENIKEMLEGLNRQQSIDPIGGEIEDDRTS
jgi:hypothetical protein